MRAADMLDVAEGLALLRQGSGLSKKDATSPHVSPPFQRADPEATLCVPVYIEGKALSLIRAGVADRFRIQWALGTTLDSEINRVTLGIDSGLDTPRKSDRILLRAIIPVEPL